MDATSDLMWEIEYLLKKNENPLYEDFDISYCVDYVEIATPYKDKQGDRIVLIAYDVEDESYYRIGNLENPAMDFKQDNPETDSSELLDLLKIAVDGLSHGTWDGLELMAEIKYDDLEDLMSGMRSMVEAIVKLDDLLRSKYPEYYSPE